MARPPMPVGTWGAVNRVQLGPGQWVARARFRDYDGVTRIVERGGASGQKAENALKEALRDRARLPGEDLTPETRLSRVAEEWTKELERRDVSDGTKDLYKRNLKHIDRGMGGLQMREVTVPAVDRFLEALLVNSGPETARLCRVVLRGICGLAVRKGAMPLNPVRDAVAIPRKAVEPRTLDVAEVVQARAQLAAWDARRTNGGALRRTDIADPVDMILGTGIRTGEVFALRWNEDVHLVDIPYIEVTGTVKEITGKGLYRQDYAKTEMSHRRLILPPFLVDALAARSRDSEYVFPSVTNTLRSPNNFRTQWRKFRTAHGYDEWVTPKTFRKAVATLVATEADDETAAGQLGHESPKITKRHYIRRLHEGPDVRAILELFAS
ncbi:tyrosine-type recombinase/integrase [uncultured Microbacterium sp.]|uniref:site-specific integrase n=1 Tax=uncultured Microbacterium sp. TaxID=191216 RepID=UPI0025FF08AC|nr:tyrosine-type recombinase/integrase [uncultured Microbacterium sp.]